MHIGGPVTDHLPPPGSDHLHVQGSDHLHFHGDDHDHLHAHEATAYADPSSPFYFLDNVHLKSIGVDIGTTTTHLTLSEVHLRREGEALSSRFIVVDRKVIWRSKISLTPYQASGLIDADVIGKFVEEGYHAAGIEREHVDTGGLILTGQALRRANARAIADAIAEKAGDFVCVSAGHHLEAMLSAYGSGSVDLSIDSDCSVLCIDIGGGTTKFARIASGKVLETAAIDIGGRLIAFDENRIIQHVTASARFLMPEGNIERGAVLTDYLEEQAASTAVKIIESVVAGRLDGLDPALLLTEPLKYDVSDVDVITFSGGVSEYVYRRESQSHGDLGLAIGSALRERIDGGAFSVPVLDPGEGIRATVTGASQCSIQVSGSTVHVMDTEVLPIRNIPVVHPKVSLNSLFDSSMISGAIHSIRSQYGLDDEATAALAFEFEGPPEYQRLRALAEGIAEAWVQGPDGVGKCIVILDGDVGASLGAILMQELGLSDVVCLDGLQLNPFDFVDIGRPVMPARVFPVVIKSLLFGDQDSH